MSEGINSRIRAAALTRRELIAGGAAAATGLAIIATSAGAQDNMTETQSTGADGKRTSLHQEVDLKSSPHRIYEALLDSKQFTACSGEPAQISREAGGVFMMFGGKIEGRNIELVPDQRIVQAWRPANWAPGEYSIVKFELKAEGSQTKVILDHTGFHEGDFGHLDAGWKAHYFERLAKYLG
jgi:activator of HSP90 ATPase